MKITVTERFWSHVDKQPGPDGCWLWTAATTGGYGRFSVGPRGNHHLVPAHRYAYECLVGPIGPGLDMDHRPTCPKRCVNPAHLRPVTHKENLENRAGATSRSRSGVRGVIWIKQTGKWRATVKHEQRNIHVGCFTTLAAAETAVIAKRLEVFTCNDVDRALP